MIRLNINGILYEVDEKYLRPVEPMEIIDVEFTEANQSEEAELRK